MNTYKLIPLLILLSLFACSETETDYTTDEFITIPVDPSVKSEGVLEDFIQSKEEIFLEETEESLIGNIARVEVTDSYIFVFASSESKILQFNRKGGFIKVMGKIGQGPEEYSRVTTFTIDQEKEQIFIADLRKILVYDFDNNFIQAISGYVIPNYLHHDGTYLEVFRTETQTSPSGGGALKYPTRYRLGMENYEQLDTLVIADIALERQMMFLMMDANYYSFTEQEKYFYLPVVFPESFVRDTLYRTDGADYTPELRLDFGDKAMGEQDKKAVNIRSIYRSSRYVMSRYTFNREAKLFIHDLENESSLNFDGGIKVKDAAVEEKVMINPISNQPNQYFYTIKKMEADATEEPNPTIVIVTMKD